MARFTPSVVTGAAVLALFGMACIGCGRSSSKVTAMSVHGDMSPELESIALTPGQRRNQVLRSADTDLRQVADDTMGILLLDRPSRMSPYPVP